MKKIKENRSERFTVFVTKTLKQEVLEWAEDKGDLTESKAIEQLIKKALRK